MSQYGYALVESPHGDKALYVVERKTGKHVLSTKNVATVDMLKEMGNNDSDAFDEAVKNMFDYKQKTVEKYQIIKSDVANEYPQIWDALQSNHIGNLEKFMARTELIEDLPSKHALLSWIEKNKSIEITPQGSVIGYKGVDDDFRSFNAGYGIVNDKAVNERHDCSPGNEISMPRELVNHDNSEPCSFGLHVGTLPFASGFGSKVVRVMFNPEDIASIDGNAHKIRVVRYLIVDHLPKEKVQEILQEQGEW